MSAHVVDLLTSNADLLDKLETAVTRWRTEHGRTSRRSGIDLARVISATVRGLRERNRRVGEDLRNGVEDADAVLSLNSSAFLARDLVRILELGSHASLHPALTPTIQAQLGELALPGNVLVSGLLSSSAHEEYSYELLTLTREFFEKFADPTELDEVSWPLLVFRVPSPPIEWPLFHTLMFHELGHALFRAHKTKLSFPNVPAELDHAVTASGADLVRQAEASERRRIFAATALKWTEELFADAVGVLMVGPGFLSSFTRMLTAFRSDIASETHPPTLLRIKLIVAALRTRALIDPLPEKARQVIEAWERESQGISSFPAATNTKPLFRTLPPLLARECEAVYPTLLAQTEVILGAQVLTPAELQLDLERGRRMLQLRIPPVEKDLRPNLSGAPGALSAPRVFSSCWAAYYQGTEAGQNPASLLARCSDALLDSLDGTEAIRAWERAT